MKAEKDRITNWNVKVSSIDTNKCESIEKNWELKLKYPSTNKREIFLKHENHKSSNWKLSWAVKNFLSITFLDVINNWYSDKFGTSDHDTLEEE